MVQFPPANPSFRLKQLTAEQASARLLDRSSSRDSATTC